MANPKQVLLDLMQELSGEFLSDVVEVRGKKWEMRLLTEEETAWSFSLINSSNQISVALSARLATLAVGIRSVNGTKISDMFQADYAALTGTDLEEYRDLPYNLAMSKLFYDFLKVQPPTFIGELYTHWQNLELRRFEAQNEVKNS